MATLQATAYTDRQIKSVPQGVVTRFATYTLAAAQVNDIVQLLKLPIGAKVIDVKWYNAALGAGSLGSVGTQTTAAYWSSAKDTSAAAKWSADAAQPFLTVDANNDTLQYKVTGAAATGLIELMVTYSMDT